MKTFKKYLIEGTLADLSTLNNIEVELVINNMIQDILNYINISKKKEEYSKNYFIKLKNKKINILLIIKNNKENYNFAGGYDLLGEYNHQRKYINLFLDISSFSFLRKNIKNEKLKKEIESTIFHELSHLERYQGKEWEKKLNNINKDFILKYKKSISKNKINLKGDYNQKIDQATTMNFKDYQFMPIEIDADISALKHFYDKSLPSLKSRIITLKDLVDQAGSSLYLSGFLKSSKKYREIFLKKLAINGIIFRNSGY